MGKIEALEFCEPWLQAWTGNQPEKLIGFYAENAYYQDPANSKGIKGREKIFNYFCKLLAKYPDWIWEVVEIFPYEKGFILKWKARLFPNQKEFFGIDIVEIEDRKITRNEVFFDPRLLLKAAP